MSSVGSGRSAPSIQFPLNYNFKFLGQRWRFLKKSIEKDPLESNNIFRNPNLDQIISGIENKVLGNAYGPELIQELKQPLRQARRPNSGNRSNKINTKAKRVVINQCLEFAEECGNAAPVNKENELNRANGNFTHSNNKKGDGDITADSAAASIDTRSPRIRFKDQDIENSSFSPIRVTALSPDKSNHELVGLAPLNLDSFKVDDILIDESPGVSSNPSQNGAHSAIDTTHFNLLMTIKNIRAVYHDKNTNLIEYKNDCNIPIVESPRLVPSAPPDTKRSSQFSRGHVLSSKGPQTAPTQARKDDKASLSPRQIVMNMTAKNQKGDSEQYGLNLTIANSKKEIDALTQDELYDQDVRKNLSKAKAELQKLEVAKSFKTYALDKKLRVPDFLRNIKVIGKRDGLHLSSTHTHEISHRTSIAQSPRRSKIEAKLNENELNETTKSLLRLLPSG